MRSEVQKRNSVLPFVLGALACLFLALPPRGFAAPVGEASPLNRLKDPLSVVHVGELRDGGTLTLGLADTQSQGDGVLFNYKRGSATQGRLYADGRIVPLGSVEQDRVLAAIKRYVNQQFTAVQQAALMQGTLTSAAQAYGERGYYASRLLHAAARLKRLFKEKP